MVYGSIIVQVVCTGWIPRTNDDYDTPPCGIKFPPSDSILRKKKNNLVRRACTHRKGTDVAAMHEPDTKRKGRPASNSGKYHDAMHPLEALPLKKRSETETIQSRKETKSSLCRALGWDLSCPVFLLGLDLTQLLHMQPDSRSCSRKALRDGPSLAMLLPTLGCMTSVCSTHHVREQT